MLFSPSHHNESNLRPTRSDTQPLIFDWKKLFIWPWWWLQLRLSKRKSLLPTTVLLGTTHTKMIKNRSNVTSGFKPFTIQTTILANIISYQQQLNKKKTTTNKHTDRERSLSNTETLIGNSIITEMIYFTGCLLHCYISLCTFDDFARSSRHFTWCCWRDQVLPHSKFYSTRWWSGEKWWRNYKNWMNQFKKYIFINYLWTPSFKRV